MAVRREDTLHERTDKYSNKLDAAIAEGKFDEALNLVLSHGILQNRVLTRMEFKLKKSIAEDLAQKVIDYANTHKGFGWNLNTLFALGQVGSGMFGLAVGTAIHTFNAAIIDKKEALKIGMKVGQLVQQAIGAAKGLHDEGNQWNKTTLQNAVENTKRRQEENKTNMQRLQSQTQELNQMAKSLEENLHRSKMN